MQNKTSKNLTYEDLIYYMNQIPGLMILNKKGNLIFVSDQCCKYMELNKMESLDKHILKVFPESKMLDILDKKDEVITSFYEKDDRVSLSTRLNISKDNKTIGVLEYDVFQDYREMDNFIYGYKNLQEKVKQLENEVALLKKSKYTNKYTIDSIIGESIETQNLRELIFKVSKTNSTVLITGETGTGKELVAHAIHDLSNRNKNNFIIINATTFPPDLIESELFGYEEGSFTGAKKGGQKGKFEMAHNGTVFIDEINQLPINIQPKLLRTLQEHEIERVGGNETVPTNFRLIAASNEDLLEKVNNNDFRRDLYYRLNIIEIKIPPLRDRKEDIKYIVEDHVKKLNDILNKNIERIEPEVIEILKGYNWPGNIRELKNCIEKAMNYSTGSSLTLENIEFFTNNIDIKFDDFNDKENPIEEMKKELERKLIINAIEKNNGNKTKAAKMLKIKRTLLHQKIKRLNIDI